MRLRTPLPLMLLAFAASAGLPSTLSAQALGKATPGPVIMDYGAAFDVPDPDFPVPTGPRKVLFQTAQSGKEPGDLNGHIEMVARYLNLHARAGVPVENMHLALVLHGGAGKDALGNEAYRKRYGVDNPSAKLIQELIGAGVQVILCGQTQTARGFHREELAPGVKVALSALTAVVTLEDEGYRLIPW